MIPEFLVERWINIYHINFAVFCTDKESFMSSIALILYLRFFLTLLNVIFLCQGCSDSSSNCVAWANLGFCTGDFGDQLKKICMKSCGVCSAGDQQLAFGLILTFDYFNYNKVVL